MMGQALAAVRGEAALWTLLLEAASITDREEAKCSAAVWNGTGTAVFVPMHPSMPHC